MHVGCRVLGHKAARYVLRDSYTFAQQSWCRRCGVPMERADGHDWEVALQAERQPRPARAPLPPLVRLVDNDELAPPSFERPYASHESREAYRRGARELYERSFDQRLGSSREELTDWFERLEAWQGGDPPPPPAMPQMGQVKPLELTIPIAQSSAASSPGEVNVLAAAPGSTDLVLRIHLEVATDAAASGHQVAAGEPVDRLPAAADENRAAGEILQLFIKR